MCWQCVLVALTLHVACGSYLAHRAAAYHGAAAAAPVYSHGGYSGHSGYSHGGYGGYESPSYDYAAYPAYSSANTYQADYSSSYSKPVDYYVSITRKYSVVLLRRKTYTFSVYPSKTVYRTMIRQFSCQEKNRILFKFFYFYFSTILAAVPTFFRLRRHGARSRLRT